MLNCLFLTFLGASTVEEATSLMAFTGQLLNHLTNQVFNHVKKLSTGGRPEGGFGVHNCTDIWLAEC